ncbi:hypothetical protein [Bacillus sp. 1P06AnD]|uniref:hypothetical protein n=1 Tax=Bacillus sp. 1P06AnD TaxID=3132208 RepID=UPI0039A1B1A3
MKIKRNAIFCVGCIVLSGWMLISLYQPITELADYFRLEEPTFNVSFNIHSILVFLLFGGLFTYLFYKDSKQTKETLYHAHPLHETDERNEQLAAKAARNSYIAMWYT